MKTIAAALLFAAAALPAWAGVTKDDVKKLAAAKVGDDVILAFIRANGGAKLSADDLVELKQAGVSETVMQALVATEAAPAARRQTDAEAMKILNGYRAPAPDESTVATTYVAPTYATYYTGPAYSTWYYPSYYYRPYSYYPSYYVGYSWGGCRSYSYSHNHHHSAFGGRIKW